MRSRSSRGSIIPTSSVSSNARGSRPRLVPVNGDGRICGRRRFPIAVVVLIFVLVVVASCDRSDLEQKTIRRKDMCADHGFVLPRNIPG